VIEPRLNVELHEDIDIACGRIEGGPRGRAEEVEPAHVELATQVLDLVRFVSISSCTPPPPMMIAPGHQGHPRHRRRAVGDLRRWLGFTQPMPAATATALLSLDIGLGVQRAIDLTIPVRVLPAVIRLLSR